VALYAIGDVQGCDAELGTLLEALSFSPDRDRLWFVGDLVNRGPTSLEVLRRVRALGEAATVTLGNHDLHLLAVALGCSRLKSDDTLTPILQAPDRDALLEWLLQRPVLAEDRALNLCLVHGGLSPQWDMPLARACARELEAALHDQPEKLFKHMYGDKPDRWDEALEGAERLRYIVNCFTRLRYVDEHGRLELHAKGAPGKAKTAALTPWFEAPGARWRGTRIVFGHWSTLGFFRNADVIGLDTGCVWGGSLTGLRLDVPNAAPLKVACQSSGAQE
jgi:bis(5'-nucleosyl)-tetraphosphatase (symmetrical)